MIHVSIIGATGYVGLELIRLLQAHPDVFITHLVSASHAGESIGSIYPSCTSMNLPKMETLHIDAVSPDTDVFFTSLPHGASQQTIAALHQTGKRIIDMSGDFRYDDPEVYRRWYNVEHQEKALLAQSVYGMPELHRQAIAKASLIGNPGCYTTTSILALAPLVKNHLIDPASIVIDAKSGVTGAGRNASQATHFCETNESLKAYGVATHRHTSEIEQELGHLAGKDVVLSFTPHLVPMQRGILATSYASLMQGAAEEDVSQIYAQMYENEPFVHICPHGQLPQIHDVRGSNMISIGFVIDKRTNRIVVVSALDNLIKGAAGQAIQNMNILFGLPEDTGLPKMAWYL